MSVLIILSGRNYCWDVKIFYHILTIRFKITFAEELKLRDNLFRFPCLCVALEINFDTDMQTCYSDIGCLCICKAIFTKKQMQSKSSNVWI